MANKELTNVPVVRCAVLGDQTAGKVTLMNKYAMLTGLDFNPQDGELLTAFNGQKCVFVDVDLPQSPMSESSEVENRNFFGMGEADVFLFCVSIANQGNVEETVAKILDTVLEHIRETPFVLVGTHIDRRTSLTIEDHKEPLRCPMPFDRAERFAKRIGARRYIECSAGTGEGVDDVFEEVFAVGYQNAVEKMNGERRRKFSHLEQPNDRKPSCIQQ